MTPDGAVAHDLCAECGSPRSADGPCPRCGAAPEVVLERPVRSDAQWARARRATWAYGALSLVQRAWLAPYVGRWAGVIAVGSAVFFAAVLWALYRRSELALRGWTGFVTLGAAMWLAVVLVVDPWQGAAASRRVADAVMALATAGCALALRRAGQSP